MVLAIVPDPKNVRVTSVNMGAVLEWDVSHQAPGNLTYTAEYSSDTAFKAVCQNQTEQRCDFTTVISPYGIYVFQVRAELQEETSQWVKTSEFIPDSNTLIGAPTVRLVSKNGSLEMDIREPVLRVSSLKEVYSRVSYNIKYWREGYEDQVTMMSDIQQTRVGLSRLEPWTRYCVQVQVFIKTFQKRGEFSEVTCETTTTNGRMEPWKIGVVLVVSFVAVSVTFPLLFLLTCYSYKGLKFLFPTAKLPEHFRQYLIEPSSHSNIFMAMQNIPQMDEQYHEVSVISEWMEGPLEEGGPLYSHSERLQGREEEAGKEMEEDEEKYSNTVTHVD
ncbi:interleukin-10 receptor subunit beta-like isoform X2 [Megalops cyprinoides]|uniref:interleukin-10 receptor subunit beta-like isoform X2 n=1 Tax=Megalops cyprinoides TaxID=118141 RepID=UPI0018641473|nr:interleukin-10 receptor subunit beta-like isoform X2 [Megalops cyprinoides]